MPMQFIVDQMTGNSPVSYFPPPDLTKSKQRKAATGKFRITDETLHKAVGMRAEGMPWDAIGRELGHSGYGLSEAVKRRGLL